jgi:hypothetical protein
MTPPETGTPVSGDSMVVTLKNTKSRSKRRTRKDFKVGSLQKYHNKYLFDYSREEIDRCLRRLVHQSEIYDLCAAVTQRRMRVRALFVAAFTLNATAIWTAKLLMKGTFSMITQLKFFRKRWRLDPEEWGANAKSCFSRALCGYSIGADGVCVDRHLQRMDLSPKDAAEQWGDWFRLYESMYGPGETVLCVRWHIELLDWIAMLSGKPVPWK